MIKVYNYANENVDFYLVEDGNEVGIVSGKIIGSKDEPATMERLRRFFMDMSEGDFSEVVTHTSRKATID